MPLYDRYPGHYVLGQRGHWDQATRQVVMDRVHNVPSFSHFNPHEQATLEALCARVIPQDRQEPDWRVPIAPWIDQQIGEDLPEGFRYDDMPDNTTAWHRGLEGIDQTAQAMFGLQFVDLSAERQDQLLEAIRGGNPPGEVWQRMPATRWWRETALRQIAGVYYAHPFAWDEIGFGGPAYPRGYFALNHGAPEPWEVQEAPPPEGGEGR